MARISEASALQRRRFDAIKEAVSVPTLAHELIEEQGAVLRCQGERWRGLCVLCGNGPHSKAFSSSEKLWHCFACGEGGDVVTLAALANDMAPGMAVAWLGHRYGVELPKRPDSWFRKQDRQARLREKLEAERLEVKRRRLFRYFVLPELEKVAEPERKQETQIAWNSFARLPLD